MDNIYLVCKFLNSCNLHWGKDGASVISGEKMKIYLGGGNTKYTRNARCLSATLKMQSLTETLYSEAVSSSCIF